MNEDINIWLEAKGKKVLSQIGIKPEMKVLDFGAREGYFAMPAADIVGSEGKVIAVEQNESSLKNLSENISKNNYSNIEIINNEGKLNFDVDNTSIDFIILFDVFHEIEEKDVLLKNFLNILKTGGVLSVFDSHIFNWAKLKDKIKGNDFKYKKNYKMELLHNYNLMKGEINNFMKI